MCGFEGICLKKRRNEVSASGSVGGVRPCQGRGRGFESRLALFLFTAETWVLSGVQLFFCVIGKFFCEELQDVKMPAFSGHKK